MCWWRSPYCLSIMQTCHIPNITDSQCVYYTQAVKIVWTAELPSRTVFPWTESGFFRNLGFPKGVILIGQFYKTGALIGWSWQGYIRGFDISQLQLQFEHKLHCRVDAVGNCSNCLSILHILWESHYGMSAWCFQWMSIHSPNIDNN